MAIATAASVGRLLNFGNYCLVVGGSHLLIYLEYLGTPGVFFERIFPPPRV